MTKLEAAKIIVKNNGNCEAEEEIADCVDCEDCPCATEWGRCRFALAEDADYKTMKFCEQYIKDNDPDAQI